MRLFVVLVRKLFSWETASPMADLSFLIGFFFLYLPVLEKSSHLRAPAQYLSLPSFPLRFFSFLFFFFFFFLKNAVMRDFHGRGLYFSFYLPPESLDAFC